MAKENRSVWKDWLVSAALRGLFGALSVLPYRFRVIWGSKLFAWVVAPLAGYRRRVANNLDLVAPELDPAERRNLIKRVPEMISRSVIELFSPEAFARIAATSSMSGPGLAVLEEARAQKRPVILVSGHFGNYNAVRSNLIQQGFAVGALYRRMNNPLFHAQYIQKMEAIGEPLFERGKPGMAGMVRFLKEGGVLAILIDQHMGAGEPLKFFGHKALTATSAAKLALKYNAPFMPAYAVRREDGLTFDMFVEAPIPHGDAADMTQALNDSLEARVRAHMDQWLWTHRRWKGT